jgi:hypothetical protein
MICPKGRLSQCLRHKADAEAEPRRSKTQLMIPTPLLLLLFRLTTLIGGSGLEVLAPIVNAIVVLVYEVVVLLGLVGVVLRRRVDPGLGRIRPWLHDRASGRLLLILLLDGVSRDRQTKQQQATKNASS